MLARPALLISIIQAALLFGSVEARTWVLERDGRAVFARKFGQTQPAVLKELAAACGGGVCAALAEEAIVPLLATQPECSQQDMADKIIDASQQFDFATQAKMVAVAMKYRQVEKNTPPDFSTNPPTHLNSVYCQKFPRNSQLKGLVQAQDPTNDPNLFFDPATGTAVTRGSQSNTSPFGANGAVIVDQIRLVARHMMDGAFNSTDDQDGGNGSDPSDDENQCDAMDGDDKNNGSSSDSGNGMKNGNMKNGNKHGCDKKKHDHKKHKDHKNGGNKNNGTDNQDGNKMNNGGSNDNNETYLNSGNNSTDSNNGGNSTSSDGNIGNFGSCSVPEIKFGAGFDGRRETAFESVDLVSYNHGSAQNIDIITQFMCDQLVNTCKADSLAQSTCAKAKLAADAAPPKTGQQADAFNAVFGKTTDFANVTPLDDQGNPVNGAVDAGNNNSTSSDGNIGNFGSCSVPEIKFGAGFDGRRETAFEPVDQVSYNHGSAQNIDIITQFMCDQLVNTCKADSVALSTCAKAKVAADAAPPKTGQQADAFNVVFGKTTDFASVTALDDQGNPIDGTGVNGTNNSGSNGNSTSGDGNIGNFGSCSVPQIKFGTGFDGRRETAFEPVDQVSYPHGSAQNIGVITGFMCDELVNTCKADSLAKSTCANAKIAADAAPPKTGQQADAFNAVFGITTNFASVTPIDDTGNPVNGTIVNGGNSGNNGNNSTSSDGGIGNFGSCSVPEIKFAAGLDGRRETAFEPVDLVSYNHGSAQNIDIITQFMCDQLVNTCKADSLAQSTCAKAKLAADATPPKTGQLADAFNAVFGKTTDFASVTPLDDHGNPIAARSVFRRLPRRSLLNRLRAEDLQ